MATYRVWGEWQDFRDALTHDNVHEGMLERLAKDHAIRQDGFSDNCDGDRATIYVLDVSKIPANAEDDEDFDATELAERYIVTLRVSYSYETKRARR